MNLVKTYIDKSDIEGIGLFANELIPKDTKIWEISGFDILIDDENFNNLNLTEEQLKYVKKHIYFKSGFWIYRGDDSRFIKCSKDPNTSLSFNEQIAIRDIYPGEEITRDYNELENDFTEQEFEEEL